MFSIFNGKVRGLGEQPTQDIYMRVSVDFRRYLRYFKGAKLAVFTSIALHADQNGWAEPTIGLLHSETDYEPSTISAAITELSSLVIDGKRVLIAVQVREKGKFIRNKYLIFPSAEEVALYADRVCKTRRTQKTANGKTVDGKTSTEKPKTENQIQSINHSEEDPLNGNTEDSAASHPLAAQPSPVPFQPDRQNGQSLTERKELEPITERKSLPRAVLQSPYEYRMTPSDNEQVQHIIAHDGARGCLCKRTPFKSPKVPLSEHEIGAVVCSGCLREYQRQTALKVRKPSIDQPVKDAIAQHIQRISPDMQTKYTGVLANLAIGAWKKKLKTNKLAPEQYEKIARSFDSDNGFLDFYKRECSDCALPTRRDTFEDWYTRFVDGLNGGGVKPKDETVTIECLTDWGAWTERDVRKIDLPTLTYQWRIPAWQKSA